VKVDLIQDVMALMVNPLWIPWLLNFHPEDYPPGYVAQHNLSNGISITDLLMQSEEFPEEKSDVPPEHNQHQG
jgi:hypothetical protein